MQSVERPLLASSVSSMRNQEADFQVVGCVSTEVGLE